MCGACWVGTLDQSTENKIFTFSDTFLGTAILGNPAGNYKTVAELVAGGMAFDAAVKEAIGQLRGKNFALSSLVSPKPFRDYVLELAGVSYSDFEGDVLQDVKIMELALAGKTDFVQPTGGPQIVTLLKQGWTPILMAKEIFDRGHRKALEASDFVQGWSAKEDWLAENHATALRLAGVAWRIIDLKKNNRPEAAAIQIPYLNSLAGTNFAVKDAQILDEVIDPFWTFEEQAEIFTDTESIYYYEAGLNALIGKQVEDGVLKTAHDPDVFILADDTWREMLDLKDRAEVLIKDAETQLRASGAEAPAEAEERLTKAKALYAGRNYLDAFRFANAARLWLEE
jgi:hypothetical protein